MPRAGLRAWPCRVWHATLSLWRKRGGTTQPARRDGRSCALLDTDNHRVGANQMLDAGILEPRLFHPSRTVGPSIVEPAGGFDQHVQAHHKSEGVHRAIVIDDAFVNDKGA